MVYKGDSYVTTRGKGVIFSALGWIRDKLTSLGTNWFSSLGTISICATVRTSIYPDKRCQRRNFAADNANIVRVLFCRRSGCLEKRIQLAKSCGASQKWSRHLVAQLAEHKVSCWRQRKMAGVSLRETSLHRAPACVMRAWHVHACGHSDVGESVFFSFGPKVKKKTKQTKNPPNSNNSACVRHRCNAAGRWL